MSNTPQVNRIVEVKLSLDDASGRWIVSVTKEFEPQYGGGSQVFQEDGTPAIHRALEVAMGMVTVSPGQRTDL